MILLGVSYDTAHPDQREAFLQDFNSRILLTYRSGLDPPLKLADGREICADSGWGCMLRVTQMMLAQSFSSIKLGRSWRFDPASDLLQGSMYGQILACFFDVPEAPLSLYRLVDIGQRMMGKAPSEWFGPTSAAKAVGALLKRACPAQVGDIAPGLPLALQRIGCIVFEDGAVVKSTVLESFLRGAEAVILLVCNRFGQEELVTALFQEGLERCFHLKEFQGMASGNSSSAHFFVGTNGPGLLFLDPHQTRPALRTEDDVRQAPRSHLFPDRPYQLQWSRLIPSACLAFVVSSADGFLQLCREFQEKPLTNIIEVLEVPINLDHLEGQAAQVLDGEDFMLVA